jgi:hypothetical protein
MNLSIDLALLMSHLASMPVTRTGSYIIRPAQKSMSTDNAMRLLEEMAYISIVPYALTLREFYFTELGREWLRLDNQAREAA